MTKLRQHVTRISRESLDAFSDTKRARLTQFVRRRDYLDAYERYVRRNDPRRKRIAGHWILRCEFVMGNAETVYFFGCWNGRAGHYLFDPRGASYRHNGLIPWTNIDGSLCYGADEKGDADIHRQVEGEAKLHHLDDWTALAWWDRSVDARYGSNAALFAKGTHTFDDMIHIMRNWFPSIMARFKYMVRP